MNKNSIRADDLKRLVRAMALEATREELTKFAHPCVADRQNFYRVYEAFDFDASVQQVQAAIKK